MKLFNSTEFNSLEDLLVEQLQDLYDAEERLTTALPKMAEAANAPELKQAFLSHLQETETHVTRLEEIFREIGTEAKRETCAAMKGLIAEGEEMISAKGDPAVKDAALIAAAQRVEHYEIAAYGTVKTLAMQLRLPEVAATLNQTLQEEGAADKKLTSIAESHVNAQAARV